MKTKYSATDERVKNIIESTVEAMTIGHDEWEQAKTRLERESRMSQYSLDDIGSAVDMLAKAKAACDKLYATYEAGVRTVDQLCRPLIGTIPASDIAEICTLISEMLEEASGIEAVGHIQYDSAEIGQGIGRYTASIEARTIEAFWKNTYNSTDEGAAVAKRIAENKERDRKLKENQKERFEKLMVAFANEEEVERILLAERASMIAAYKKQIEAVLCKRLKKSELEKNQETEKQTEELRKKKLAEQEALDRLGFFKFSEKKLQREKILSIDQEMEKAKENNNVDDKKSEMETISEMEISKYRDMLDRYLKSVDLSNIPGMPDKEDLLYEKAEIAYHMFNKMAIGINYGISHLNYFARQHEKFKDYSDARLTMPKAALVEYGYIERNGINYCIDQYNYTYISSNVKKADVLKNIHLPKWPDPTHLFDEIK